MKIATQGFLDNRETGEATWLCYCEPLRTAMNTVWTWKGGRLLQNRKAMPLREEGTLHIFFFTQRALCYRNHARQARAARGEYYTDSVLSELNKHYGKARPASGMLGTELLHDNAPARKSKRERRENFLLQSQLCVLTLYLVSVPPPCYGSGTLKTPVILPKVQVAGHTYTRMWTDPGLKSGISVRELISTNPPPKKKQTINPKQQQQKAKKKKRIQQTKTRKRGMNCRIFSPNPCTRGKSQQQQQHQHTSQSWYLSISPRKTSKLCQTLPAPRILHHVIFFPFSFYV